MLHDPMPVSVYFSGGASSLDAMLKDPNHGKKYRVIHAFTNREDEKNEKGRRLCAEHGIDVDALDWNSFFARNKLDPKDDASKEIYFESAAVLTGRYSPELICCSGFMKIIREPLLTLYEGKILNVHPADLTVFQDSSGKYYDFSRSPQQLVRLKRSRDPTLQRAFKGDKAVRDTVATGQKTIRSTVHYLTSEVDEGPILVQSKEFQIKYDEKLNLQQYCDKLQERMKIEGDGPAYVKAINLIADGRVEIRRESVFIDKSAVSYCGLRLS